MNAYSNSRRQVTATKLYLERLLLELKEQGKVVHLGGFPQIPWQDLAGFPQPQSPGYPSLKNPKFPQAQKTTASSDEGDPVGWPTPNLL